MRSTDWNPLTGEDAHKIQDDMTTYAISKALAEKALWKFAEEHEDLNLVSSKYFKYFSLSRPVVDTMSLLKSRCTELHWAAHSRVPGIHQTGGGSIPLFLHLHV